MSRIREKATESEAVVRNITKEIQVLDLAKRNLIQSMTTLKRLQMLGASVTRLNTARSYERGVIAVNALSQLEDQVKEDQYAEIAQTLGVHLVSFLRYNVDLYIPRL